MGRDYVVPVTRWVNGYYGLAERKTSELTIWCDSAKEAANIAYEIALIWWNARGIKVGRVRRKRP